MTTPDGDDATRRATWPAVLGVLAAALVVHGLIQLGLPGFADRDAWFHGRYAELVGRGEIPWSGTAFPWLTHSAFATNPMDWSLLWHLLLAPFTVGLGAVTGLKAFAALQAALLTAAFYAVLRAQDVRGALAWTVLLVVISPEWLFRVHFARPTPLVIATMLAVAGLVLARRDRLAAVGVAVSLLLYHVPAPIVLAAGAAWLGRSVAEGRPAWRSALHLAIGGVAGLLLHPGLWDGGTLHVWGLMAGSLEAAAAGGVVDVGNGYTIPLSLPDELGRPGVRGMLTELWQPLLATAVALVAGWRARRRGAAVTGALLAAAGLVATWRSGRFYEYWHVLALLGAALTISRPDGPGRPRDHTRIVAGIALVLGVLGVRTLLPLMEEHGRDGGWALAPALDAVHERSRPGDVVWHLSWDDFAPLFHFAPDLRFHQGMDPWWCVTHDLEGALAHALAANGTFEGDALREILIARFRARFVVLWAQPEDGPDGVAQVARVAARLDAVPWATRLHADDATIVYELQRP